MADTYTCDHCGAADVGTPEAGYARGAVTNAAGQIVGATLCHPNEPGRPDCYRLVAVYRHPMPCAPCTAGVLSAAKGSQDSAAAGLVDVLLPDGTHQYWSTHCRHGNHEACSATSMVRDRVARGPAEAAPRPVEVLKTAAQCKTCASPCICPCHKGGTDETTP